MWDRRLRNQARLGCFAASSLAPDGFDGVPHLTPEGKPLPEKLLMASVKILFSRGQAPYRECGTTSMIELLRLLLEFVIGLVKVARKVKLMVGYTCQTRVRI
jgi:hypothetical protein